AIKSGTARSWRGDLGCVVTPGAIAAVLIGGSALDFCSALSDPLQLPLVVITSLADGARRLADVAGALGAKVGTDAIWYVDGCFSLATAGALDVGFASAAVRRGAAPGAGCPAGAGGAFSLASSFPPSLREPNRAARRLGFGLSTAPAL